MNECLTIETKSNIFYQTSYITQYSLQSLSVHQISQKLTP